MKEINYVVYYLDEDGNPEEWCASASTLEQGSHYLFVYAEDSTVGLFEETLTRKLIAYSGDSCHGE